MSSSSAAERRTFSASGLPGDQHQSLARLGQFAQSRGQVQRFESGNFFGQQADASGDGAALMVHVGAKAPDAFAAEAEVDRFGTLEFLRLFDREQRKQQLANFLGIERLAAGSQYAGDAQTGRSAGDQQQVGGRFAHGLRKQLVERGEVFFGILARFAGSGRGTIKLGDDLG